VRKVSADQVLLAGCQKSDWKAGHQNVCNKASNKDKENALKA